MDELHVGVGVDLIGSGMISGKDSGDSGQEHVCSYVVSKGKVAVEAVHLERIEGRGPTHPGRS